MHDCVERTATAACTIIQGLKYFRGFAFCVERRRAIRNTLGIQRDTIMRPFTQHHGPECLVRIVCALFEKRRVSF